MKLPEALRSLRLMHDLTQADLSDLCGHGQSWCSKVERGIKDPTVRDLALLSHAYGLQLVRGEWTVLLSSRAKRETAVHS